MNSNQRTPSGDAFAELAISVLRLAGHLTSEGDRLARPSDQTSARWQVLAAASHAPMSVADAARMLGLARQGVQRIADLLEAEGLLAYRDNPAHRRAKLMIPTQKGEAVLADISSRQTAWANALGAEIGEERLRRATALVSDVITLLSDRRTQR
ncbi:MarR family winged helix-turn-helix transcriptional regulator [Sinorhizobium alkalisoli]|uniref:MarR family transcriptional regulator n=1 Tax=Sinorhizobium alkalisoli TaxID=1752398 RepID=A0A1E3VAS7_9HYPH|nr:helix-turn-helix domain-containing protein [Sinorhizobium alkalisoli]MCA1491994.1 MarR family transcriptional regulator [Ensifer sp. NBAIM29]MCG5479463.1 MarR family winged helix-turn-helix transcriptional regulator [Sinorhizobium alkalisoli]ODR90537.1 MarR family transcriptional regulator [Sinorhizobium alkalisoli]QFI67661.1 Transcriptional regulator, MarR family [Sinorhizobium alkalisoli]